MAVVTKVKCNRDISKTKKLIATDFLFFKVSQKKKKEIIGFVELIKKKTVWQITLIRQKLV